LTSRQIPEASVARLPVYLRALVGMAERGTHTVSSEALATTAGVNSAKIRKDLSYLGSYGVRGVGYDVDHLRRQIEKELGACTVAIIGAGNLGMALSRYRGFAARGFALAGVFDNDPEKVGRDLDGVSVESMEGFEEAVQSRGVAIAIIATPGDAAQEVAERVAAAGVTSILNFAPVVLQLPAGVDVRRVDLSTELQILSFYLQHRESS
jgi:redox-sensing transcriptional repressor